MTSSNIEGPGKIRPGLIELTSSAQSNSSSTTSSAAMSTQSQYMAHTSDGDQRNESQADKDSHKPTRFEAGKENSHQLNDPKDGRSIANRIASELSKNEDTGHNPDPNILDKNKNPTSLAKEHGNTPSRGAVIDEQIQLEEEAELRKKGILP